ncbi:relaxase/mobilization nuclease domain-containing protein [Actinomyces succiniciruminis]|uniref:Relaxase/mobilization nuclease domain protein n=1 Tax=Actinomyces succiniciruminis TaxID=1522002 RepID=A0A1L7RM84_9ACTO|nr:relaxase/mobilization nuclease domain-containing protein [Actinomyces succiniciruminis]CED91300.1 Relaxase/mobilization nuclease domain protein [Actinomyces succiniciruminis]
MIAAIVEGGSTPGLINYLVGPGRSNEHSSQHLVAGSGVIMRRWGDWEQLTSSQGYEIAKYVDSYMNENGARPVGNVRRFNHETGRREVVGESPTHVWHCSLSLSPDEDPLSDAQWQKIADDFMRELGFTGADGKAPCRWAAIRHGQSKSGGDHIHIVANIVREDGTRWSNWQDQRRAGRACNKLEHRYGLRVLESREHARGARADSAQDLRASERRQERATDRARLEGRVRAAAVGARSEADFVRRLRDYGVRARPRFESGRTDVVVGYSVALHSYDDTARVQWYGGGRLARDLTLPRLRARWEDTPDSADRAVRAWQHAWRGDTPRTPAHRKSAARDVRTRTPGTGDWQARTAALRTYRERLRGIDASDPVALADATRDISGMLSAQALARADVRERELLDRAARAVGRHAQTHARPAPPRPVPDAIMLATQAASIALVTDPQAAQTLLAIEMMQLVRSLAALYDQEQQTNTARMILADTAEAFALINREEVRPLGDRRLQMATASQTAQHASSTVDGAGSGGAVRRDVPAHTIPAASRTDSNSGRTVSEGMERTRRIFELAAGMPAGQQPKQPPATSSDSPEQRPPKQTQARRTDRRL